MVGIAILGAGIFALEQHLPAIEESETFELKAVYSRSQKSAESLSSKAKGPADVYFDNPTTDGKSLDDLLARVDISAVVICLPILVQPDIIRKAVAAGKHVLSEKPIAKDVATAQFLLEWYSSQHTNVIWGVAENFRFIESVQYAASHLKSIGGKVTTFRLNMNALIQEDDQYFNTPWRKVPEYQGGFLLDGGVHFIAGLRLLLSQVGQEIKQVACFSALLEEKLPPVDTVHAIASTQDGKSGTLSISFGTEFKSGLELEVVTTNGAIIWSNGNVTTKTRGVGGKATEERKEFAFDAGVKAELEAFGKAIKAGTLDPLQSPGEGLKDLEILQALLESGSANASVKRLEL
ncbi:NAD(P)-binding protein [Thozetella sp. PMI_491]|nr:NAD(P)-binding protein [Thozetella sp. PMI_491]